jgi:hypothetical protein
LRTDQVTALGWRLQPRDEREPHEPDTEMRKRHVLRAVARRSGPGLLEASLIPAAIFLLTKSFLGATSAMLAVLLWGAATVTWRRHRGRTTPTLVIVALCALFVRTLVGVLSGSTFAYFVQPVATMIAIAAVFLLSVFLGRPVVARIAQDFCPISPDIAKRPAVIELFAGLTILWATAQLITAAATLTMLLSLNTTLFVVLKPFVTMGISAAAVAITITWALRTAHREELVFATV